MQSQTTSTRWKVCSEIARIYTNAARGRLQVINTDASGKLVRRAVCVCTAGHSGVRCGTNIRFSTEDNKNVQAHTKKNFVYLSTAKPSGQL